MGLPGIAKNPFFLLKSSEIERQGNLHAFYKNPANSFLFGTRPVHRVAGFYQQIKRKMSPANRLIPNEKSRDPNDSGIFGSMQSTAILLSGAHIISRLIVRLRHNSKKKVEQIRDK
ncbi:MAG TPA: hypothetical protein DEP43_03030 [Ruminococcaceae bacterium]|nr:hypothetical protein [Oscillospiraceae bacterium]